MTANQTSPRAGAGAPRHALIERRLRRYARCAQERVRALAQRHPRLADLAASFPPLLFALALPRSGHDPERAIACVIEGRPLGEAAAAAEIPLWLRRLPVGGLTQPLPALPAGELFGRRIVNHLPRSPKRTTAWLATVSDAVYWVHEPFAIWIARELARDAKTVRMDRLRLAGLWAWFSQHPDTDGYRLIETPWRFEMGFKAALAAARAWLDRVTLELSLGERQIADLWLRPGPFDGHQLRAARLGRTHRPGGGRDGELHPRLRVRCRPRPLSTLEHPTRRTTDRKSRHSKVPWSPPPPHQRAQGSAQPTRIDRGVVARDALAASA